MLNTFFKNALLSIDNLINKSANGNSDNAQILLYHWKVYEAMPRTEPNFICMWD